MNSYMSRLEKKTQEEDNQKFASKKQGIFIFLPCWIQKIKKARKIGTEQKKSKQRPKKGTAKKENKK